MGRDAVYLDRMFHDIDSAYLLFEGQLKSSVSSSKHFTTYKLRFLQPIHFNCTELDRYKNEKYLSSSFDLVLESELLKTIRYNNNNYQHFILATYDFVYEIICIGYEME